jgi:serine/threonine protein kinase
MSLPSEHSNKRSQFERQYKHKSRAQNNLGSLKVLENPATKSRIFMREHEFSDAESFENALRRYKARIQSKNSFFVEFFDFATFTKIDKKCQIYRLRVFVEYFPATLQSKIDELRMSQVTLPYDQMAKLMYFFLRAGKFLQTQKKCHGDIRPSNILLFDKPNQIKFLERLTRLSLPFPHNQTHSESNPNGKIEERPRESDVYICPLILKSLKSGKKLPVSFDIQKSEVFSAGLCILEAGIGRNVQVIYQCSGEEINASELGNLLKEFQANYSKSSVIFNTLRGMLSVYENDRKTSSQLLDEFRSVEYALEEVERDNLLNSSKMLSQVNASFYDATFLESQRSISSNFYNENSFLQPSSRRISRLDHRSFNKSADIQTGSRNSTLLQVPTQHMGFFTVSATEKQNLMEESNRFIETYSKMQQSEYSIDLSFQQSNISIQMPNGFAPSNRFMNDPNIATACNFVPNNPRMSTATNAETRPSKIVLYKGSSKRQIGNQQNHEPMPHLQPSNFQRQVIDPNGHNMDAFKAKHSRNFSLDPRATYENQLPVSTNQSNFFSKNKNSVVYYEETQMIPEEIKAVFNQKEGPQDHRSPSLSKQPANFVQQQMTNQNMNHHNQLRMNSPVDSRTPRDSNMHQPRQSTFAHGNADFIPVNGLQSQNTSHSPSPFQKKSDSVFQPSTNNYEMGKPHSHHMSISQQQTSPAPGMRRNETMSHFTVQTTTQSQNQQIKPQPNFDHRSSNSPAPLIREYHNPPPQNLSPTFAVKNPSHSPSPFAKPPNQSKITTIIAHQRTNISPQPVVMRKEPSTSSFIDMGNNNNPTGMSIHIISTQSSDQNANSVRTPNFRMIREESSTNFSHNVPNLGMGLQTGKRQSESGVNVVGKSHQTSNFFNV